MHCWRGAVKEVGILLRQQTAERLYHTIITGESL